MTLIELLFPNLARSGFRVTSPHDEHYNCIAWAAGDTTDWWWPGPNPDLEYWPPGLVREVNISAFHAMFTALGYVPCVGEDLEPNTEKIAVYANGAGKPTHAARQLSNGRWTSKLGNREDIEHALHDLEGDAYGTVALIMRRPTPQPNH